MISAISVYRSGIVLPGQVKNKSGHKQKKKLIEAPPPTAVILEHCFFFHT